MSKEQIKEVAKVEPTYSQRFTNMVVREFSRELGNLEMTPYQERLAQHLFIGVDISLKKLEADRLKKDTKKLPIVWTNVNMEKLAIDAVHRVELGLDALIPNHIHTIPYLNGKTGKYDLDLQIGYVGKDYYKREMALVPPKDIIYRLVYANDVFDPIMQGADNAIDTYKLQIPNPFDRGEVIGGFGYILYDDPTLNRLIIVSKASFDKSQKKAQSDAFWGPYTEEMQMVALVRRVTAKLNIDPRKVNASYLKVEVAEAADSAEREIEEKANQEIIDINNEEEQQSTKIESIWDPYKSEIQKRYGADKVNILKDECEIRAIDIRGLLPREAHEKLLELIAKQAEQAKGGQGEAPEQTSINTENRVKYLDQMSQIMNALLNRDNYHQALSECGPYKSMNDVPVSSQEEVLKAMSGKLDEINEQAASGEGPEF